MAKNYLNQIFLSASIPDPERDKRYYSTTDIFAIRDSVRALASIVIPNAHLIWGGHPSITPLIRSVMSKIVVNVQDHVTLYLSNFFKDKFSPDIFDFEKIIFTEKLEDLDDSILLMRKKMINENDFSVGIFIGGMEGVEKEFDLFTMAHPKALVLPIASTGAAAKIIYENNKNLHDERLLNDYAYMSLFKDLLSNILKLKE